MTNGSPKSLAKLILPSLAISSVGIQVSAMEQKKNDAVKKAAEQMMWELDNSIHMATQTKLDFLCVLQKALKEHIRIICAGNSNNHFYDSIIYNMEKYKWTCCESLTATNGNLSFPSLSYSRREYVMNNIKELCNIITHTNWTELEAFCALVQNKYSDFLNNSLNLYKQHSENDKSYDLNSGIVKIVKKVKKQLI